MLVNLSKTSGMLISRTVEPLFPDLVVDGTVVEMVSELKILGAFLDSKVSLREASQSNSCFCLEESWYFDGELVCLEKSWYFDEDNELFFEMSLLLPNAFRQSYSMCWGTFLQFGCVQPLPTSCCLIVLLAKLAN